MKRWLRRITISVIAIATLLAIVAWVTLTFVLTRPQVYQPKNDVGPVTLRTWPEHDAIYQSVDFPYVLSIQTSNGSLEYIGAKHTSDAGEPQLTEIERRWEQFKPTVALCEGRARMFRFASRNQTGRLSESELTRILANQSGIPLYTLEPTYEAEVAGLLEHFEPELVATYMTLRVYSSEADHQSGQNQDDLARSLLKKRTDVEGLRKSLSNVSQLDAYWS